MRTLIAFLIAAVAASASAKTSAGTQKKVKEAPVKSIPEVAGGATFKEYCSVCHGVEGRGNGPAAGALKTPPTDLTQISKRAGGKFPFATIKSKITGDDVVAAHGTRDMPIWGSLFRQADSSSSVAELRLTNLIDYIEKLQAK